MGSQFARAQQLSTAPVVAGELSEELRQMMLQELPDSEQSLLDLGFEAHVDHVDCDGHRYMEGYFHGLATVDPVRSFHPRFGTEILRPAAPKTLAAFCEAMRRCSATWLEALRQDWARSEETQHFAELLKRGAHFADLSVQVHWGDCIPQQAIAWHIDAPNSLLHLAVSLQGRRSLHARRAIVDGRISGNCLIGTKDERDVLWQHEGSAYLSSPCSFPHAVEYPACDWDHRIVAVQCRLLFDRAEALFQQSAGRLGPDSAASAVFRRLGSVQGGLRLPSRAEVEAVLSERQFA